MPSAKLILYVVVLAGGASWAFWYSFRQNQLLARRWWLGFGLNLGLGYGWVRLLQHAALWTVFNPLLQGVLALVVLFVADTILSVLLMWPFKNRQWRP